MCTNVHLPKFISFFKELPLHENSENVSEQEMFPVGTLIRYVLKECTSGQSIQIHCFILFLLSRRLEWKNFEVVVVSKKTIHVRNVTNDAKEKLEFRDRIIKTSVGFDYVVVATSSQCYVYR